MNGARPAEVTRLERLVLAFAAAADKRLLDDFDRCEWLAWQVEIRDTGLASSSKPPRSPA